jgi:hypothetical protein
MRPFNKVHAKIDISLPIVTSCVLKGKVLPCGKVSMPTQKTLLRPRVVI